MVSDGGWWWVVVLVVFNPSLCSALTQAEQFHDIEIGFELTLLTYKVFLCKDLRSKFLGVRLLAVQSNTQSRS